MAERRSGALRPWRGLALALAGWALGAQGAPLPVDCPPHDIRYSLLVPAHAADRAPATQGWRQAPLREAQAAALPLGGDVELSMQEYLASRGQRTPTLLTRCLPPPRPGDLAAYLQAMDEVLTTAAATQAVAVGDGETGDWLRPVEFRRRLHEGQSAGQNRRVAADNPPAMGILSSAFNVDDDPRWGLRTRGLRKLGLPDLSLGPPHPGHSLLGLLQALGDMALAGRLPLAPGPRWDLSLHDPAFARHRGHRPASEAPLAVRWVPEPDAPSPLLRLELVGDGEGLHPFEQQALMVEALWGSPYAALGPERARALGLAVARSKHRLRELLDQFPRLQAQGARLWVVQRLDLDARALAQGQWTGEFLWDEVRSSDPAAAYPLRRWTGDPRHGGKVQRRVPPLVVDGQRFEFDDSSFRASTADDWLLQDASGRFTAGEPLALLRAWAAAAAPPSTRPATPSGHRP